MLSLGLGEGRGVGCLLYRMNGKHVSVELSPDLVSFFFTIFLKGNQKAFFTSNS